MLVWAALSASRILGRRLASLSETVRGCGGRPRSGTSPPFAQRAGAEDCGSVITFRTAGRADRGVHPRRRQTANAPTVTLICDDCEQVRWSTRGRR
jgi:hypothetical protein